MLEIFNLLKELSELTWTPPILSIGLILIALFIYFLPLIIQKHYWQITPGIFFITLFFGWTPLPYIIVILNIVEQKQIQILKAQGLLEKVPVHPIYKDSQSTERQPISETSNSRLWNSNNTEIREKATNNSN